MKSVMHGQSRELELPSMTEHRLTDDLEEEASNRVNETVSVGQRLLEEKWGKRYPKLCNLFNDNSTKMIAAQTAILCEHQDRYIENMKKRWGEADNLASINSVN